MSSLRVVFDTAKRFLAMCSLIRSTSAVVRSLWRWRRRCSARRAVTSALGSGDRVGTRSPDPAPDPYDVIVSLSSVGLVRKVPGFRLRAKASPPPILCVRAVADIISRRDSCCDLRARRRVSLDFRRAQLARRDPVTTAWSPACSAAPRACFISSRAVVTRSATLRLARFDLRRERAGEDAQELLLLDMAPTPVKSRAATVRGGSGGGTSVFGDSGRGGRPCNSCVMRAGVNTIPITTCKWRCPHAPAPCEPEIHDTAELPVLSAASLVCRLSTPETLGLAASRG